MSDGYTPKALDRVAELTAEVRRLRLELQTVAERQREACAQRLRKRADKIMDDGGDRRIEMMLRMAALDYIRTTPLVESRTSMFGADFPPCPKCGRSVLAGKCCEVTP